MCSLCSKMAGYPETAKPLVAPSVMEGHVDEGL